MGQEGLGHPGQEDTLTPVDAMQVVKILLYTWLHLHSLPAWLPRVSLQQSKQQWLSVAYCGSAECMHRIH